MNKAEVVELLKSGLCVITFIKADNTERVMLGTLVPTFIQVESAGESKPNEAVVPVWDCEKDAWRAFRMDRLKAIRVATQEEIIGLAMAKSQEQGEYDE